MRPLVKSLQNVTASDWIALRRQKPCDVKTDSSSNDLNSDLNNIFSPVVSKRKMIRIRNTFEVRISESEK